MASGNMVDAGLQPVSSGTRLASLKQLVIETTLGGGVNAWWTCSIDYYGGIPLSFINSSPPIQLPGQHVFFIGAAGPVRWRTAILPRRFEESRWVMALLKHGGSMDGPKPWFHWELRSQHGSTPWVTLRPPMFRCHVGLGGNPQAFLDPPVL